MTARDRGSATVLAIGVIAVVLVVLGGALTAARAVRAAARAAAAADMAALAGARVLQTAAQAPACAQAARTAARNGASLVSCTVHGQDLTIRVVVDTAIPGLGPATARARAGPAAGSAE